jgi:hypothetical protein
VNNILKVDDGQYVFVNQKADEQLGETSGGYLIERLNTADMVCKRGIFDACKKLSPR